ncbi:hypothetical protein WL05_07190 [Burkholderia ubonensis]|uniref:hypothetical protein n=1 Tax=Burkholderia ubonensis TaxID=101571 RepID=UPI000758B0DE|nr:hypothetical protein [Burkholderia ubonensis]KVM08545.1 hypothetical protein WJ51_21410 [Burkholderia ubonensis]KVM15473.1 hypothetical protein WJ52_14930 [Burkholderia ubonensis]KVM53643.1 hypothetical protein WJ56_00530 [Burkholderia ubonensis]KVX55205.1 hypothetical protein WL05_07190 [Burkholderia ubonensis]KVX98249.1 hypothetical protein WL10_32625 [Burkholderia ubonensis]
MDAETPTLKQATTQIQTTGGPVTVTTALSLEELDKNGIAWCQPVKELEAQTNPLIRLGTYLNVANICAEAQRFVDEIGALRRLAREFGRQLGDISQRVDALLKRGLPMPDLPQGWTIVPVDHDEIQFKLLAGIDGDLFVNFWHPGAKFGGLAGTPGIEALGAREGIDNASFHVCFNGALVATVPVAIDASHAAAWVTHLPTVGCMPIEVHFTDAPVDRREAYKVIVACLKYLSRSFGASNVTIMERPEEQYALYKQIIKKARTYSAEIWDRPYVDLSQETDELFSGVRKSYRSNINWCAKNLVVEYFTGDAITNERVRYFYEVIQDLHKELIAKYSDGMTTDLFMHPILMCRNGQGEVAISKTADGVPYGMTVTTYDGGIAYYALAGSRTLNGKNVGHYVVYDSILRAKAKGLKKYAMNRFFAASVSLNQRRVKEMVDRAFTIAFFKRGFSDDCEFANVYQIFL